MLSKIPVQTFRRKAASKAANFPSCAGGGGGDPAAEGRQAAAVQVVSLARMESGASLAMTRFCGATKATAALGWE